MHLTVWHTNPFTRLFALLLALSSSSCAMHPAASQPLRPTTATPIITPDYSLAAKVVSVNTAGRFVVLSFPENLMPKVEQTLFLYRNGLKTGAVRVTGPQQESNIVADLTAGEAQVGDTVRDQ